MSQLFTEQEVKRIADLAMIDLTAEEVQKLSVDLNVINDSISVVTKAVEEAESKLGIKIPPATHPIELETVLREDIPATLETGLLTASDATAGAPKVENEMFVAPKILGEE